MIRFLLKTYNLIASCDSIALHTMSCTKPEDVIHAVKFDGAYWFSLWILFFGHIELKLCRNYTEAGTGGAQVFLCRNPLLPEP